MSDCVFFALNDKCVVQIIYSLDTKRLLFCFYIFSAKISKECTSNF